MRGEDHVCQSIVLSSFVGETPTVLFAFGCLQVVNLFIIILYIRRQARLAAAAQTAALQAADRIIFPSLAVWLYAVGFANISSGIMSIFVLRSLEQANSLSASLAFGISYGLSHFALDGIAFLLIQNGCGSVSMARATYSALLWGTTTMIIMTFRFHSSLYGIGFWLQLAWESTQVSDVCYAAASP
jgi:hypothetical protein